MLVNNIKQALLVSFNKANKMRPYLEMEDILWLNVEIWLQGSCNSRVTVASLANSVNFEERRTLYFTRRDIAKDLRGLKIPGKRSQYSGLKAIIKALHDKCGVPLDEAAFLEAAIPASGPVTIQPTTQCMAYLPTTSIALTFADE